MPDFDAHDQAQQLNVGGDNHGPIDAHTEQHLHEAPAPPREPVTAVLPPAPRIFVGRDRELHGILDAVRGGEQAASIHAIDGMAGVGKTALAVRAAHAMVDRFPDGRYFLELHAHTPGRTPAHPTEVLAGLLAGLGMDARQIPEAMAERRDLWRNYTANRKILVILDDAASHTQVEPLLPSGEKCLTLITSRQRLILPDMRPLPVTVLTVAAARDLFLTLANRDRSHAAEQEAADRIVTACGCLPLAIGPIAAHIAHHPAWTAADIVEHATQLASVADRLSALDPRGDMRIRAAFDVSYQSLPPQRRLLFRRLGLHPGPTLEPYAVAALAGVNDQTAHRELEALYTDHLLDETARDRYQLHDLLRDYARALTLDESSADASMAVERLLDYYLDRATRPEAGPEEKLAWMRIERDNLLACLDHSSGHDSARMVALTVAIEPLLRQDGPWPLAIELHQRAARTARGLGDHSAEASALEGMGRVRLATGDYRSAADLFGQAIAMSHQFGHRRGEAAALNALGRVRLDTGDCESAIALFAQALTLYQQLEDRLGEGGALDDLARARLATGDYVAATELLDQALVLHRALGDRRGEANALECLGRIRLATGDRQSAPATEMLFDQARRLHQEIGNRRGEANALDGLGRVRLATADYRAAADLFERSLVLHQEIGNRRGEGNALEGLGRVVLATSDYRAAADLFERSLVLHQEIGERRGEGNALDGLGRVRLSTSDYAGAAELFERALTIHREIGNRRGESNAQDGLDHIRESDKSRSWRASVDAWLRRLAK